MKKYVRFSVLLLLFSSYSTSSLTSSPHGGDPKRLTIEQLPVAQVAVSNPSINVNLWLDKPAGSELYKPGESTTIYVSLDKTAHITVINVDAKGATTVLFPNKFHTKNQIQAGQTVSIPAAGAAYRFKVEEPYGPNLIKVFATTSTVKLVHGANYEQSSPFMTTNSSSGQVAEFIQKQIGIQQQHSWGAAKLAFGVVPHQNAAAPVVSSPSQHIAPQAVPPQHISNPLNLDQLATDFGLLLKPTKSHYKPNESISVAVTTEKRCDLALISVTHQGQASVLYPNSLSGHLVIDPKRSEFLPRSDGSFALQAASQPGNYALLAVCAYKPGFWDLLLGRDSAKAQTKASIAAKPLMSVDEILNMNDDKGIARTVARYTVSQ